MEINLKQDLKTVSSDDKENIKSEIEDTLKSGHLIAPPNDGIVNIFLYSDNNNMFKILGTAKDSNNNFLFTFSYLNNSMSYDSTPPSGGGK
ncbi:MAG: hypothetical protein Q8N95_09565 [Desulfobacterales bacterium]|nr:hypothetical protein [Desulfobacterales bacterium]